jgi:release factor glutamine methyltransferase
LLAEALRAARAGGRVLDVGTGTGALALVAALSGAAEVIAVDDCRRAVLAARVNAWSRRLPVRVIRSDLFEAVAGHVFDVIVANPPYVWSDGCSVAGGPAHMWDGGLTGRMVLDRLCSGVFSLLAPGGMLLLVQSALCGVPETIRRLRAEGLEAVEIARRQEAFGPVMLARIDELENRGLIRPGQRYEDLVVIRACRAER